MQLDPKARVERTLYHAVTMNLEDSRRCESTHQRLSHLGRVRARFGGEQQGFGYRLYVQRHDDLVGHLGRLTVAVFAYQRDVLAHQVEEWLRRFERVLGTADHDRERSRLRTHFAAGHGRV